MQVSRIASTLVVGSLIVILGAGCSTAPEAMSPSPVTETNTQVVTPTPEPTPATTTTSDSNVKVINISASDWKWDPGTINVNKGDHVKIVVTNNDPVAHGFGLTEFNVNVNIDSGATQTIEFVADQAGTFNFFCSVPCGPGHRGMKGTLIVT